MLQQKIDEIHAEFAEMVAAAKLKHGRLRSEERANEDERNQKFLEVNEALQVLRSLIPEGAQVSINTATVGEMTVLIGGAGDRIFVIRADTGSDLTVDETVVGENMQPKTTQIVYPSSEKLITKLMSSIANGVAQTRAT